MRVDAILYARAQMGLSLAFHIVFAAAGVALPPSVRFVMAKGRGLLNPLEHPPGGGMVRIIGGVT